MKPILITLTVLVLTCGVTYGQNEPGPGFEHLKDYGPFIGNWRYEGPLLEDVPDIAEKGTDFVFQLSWKRVLNKNVVEVNWSIKFKGGTELAGKAMNGWNADRKAIVSGGMDSLGAMSMGTVVFDKAAKSKTSTLKGVDGEGEEISNKLVVTVTGEDTITWQALERTGGIVEGPSPPYTFKRVKRVKKAAK